MDDPHSLDNLRDIVVPDPPPFWPPSPGFWVLLGMLVVVVVSACWWFLAARKRNAHRRAGLALLSASKTAHDVSVVLKRVALAVFPREQVAPLYGEEWIAFLNRTCPRSHFTEIATADCGAEAHRELIERASTWIRHHRVSEGPPSNTEN